MKNGLIEQADGSKCWYFNGKLHRVDGPAIECTSGQKEWYFHGKFIREEKLPQIQTNWKQEGF